MVAINNDDRKFMTCKFFDELKLDGMLGFKPGVVCGKQNTYFVSK